MKKHVFIVLLSAICLSGCFPYHYTDRPGVRGSVVDELGGASIPNATIVVRTHDLKQRTTETHVNCQADGRFYLAPKRWWGVYIVPMDVFGPWSEATLTAPGFEPKTLRLPTSAMGPSKVDLGEVTLVRAP